MKIIYNQEKSIDISYGVIELWSNSNLLFSVTGNLKEFLTWLISVKEYMFNEHFFFGNENISLAQRLYCAREIEFNDELAEDNIVSDYWHEQIFEYYKNHGLVYGLRGFNNKNIILGKNQGHGEFSCYEDGKELFRYDFDFNEFYRVVESKYQEILNKS